MNKLNKMSNLKEINISNLIFDEKVADMIEKNNCSFPASYLNNLCELNTFKLDQNKLNSILKSEKILYPIFVIKGLGDKYIVMNGRHRVCASIMNNHQTIECLII